MLRGHTALLLLCVSLAGLTSSCGPGPSDDEGLTSCRDNILNALFTEEAARSLSGVPLRFGNTAGAGGMASGDDPLVRLGSALTGNGWDRQVILSSEQVYVLTIFHEYVHQAQHSGLISKSLFRQRFDQMSADPDFGCVASAVQDFILRHYTDFRMNLAYDDGLTRELTAWCMELWSRGAIDLPPYMLEVYERALNLERIRVARETYSQQLAEYDAEMRRSAFDVSAYIACADACGSPGCAATHGVECEIPMGFWPCYSDSWHPKPIHPFEEELVCSDVLCREIPTVSVEPLDLSSRPICEGESRGFSVNVSSYVSQRLMPTFQWRKNGSDLADGPRISGTHDNRLYFTSVAPDDAGDYECIYYSACQSPVSSGLATLSVLAQPAIAEQPQSQNVCAGSPVICVLPASLHESA